eukprot:CAMPEP_0198430148 /NCGR_PEP_ID=MMETSP1452-20131203/11891_1 /TAXON_ID=1181717 /ORGANISM="Synchroma pusillum, Strain CCMP3072" /LENGTH=46 /DNA_ID= /DNA_START= /DNA_END= /DNA_ORIENTATION=
MGFSQKPGSFHARGHDLAASCNSSSRAAGAAAAAAAAAAVAALPRR